MFSTPVLIGGALLACLAVAIGVLLGRHRNADSTAPSDAPPPTLRSEKHDLEELGRRLQMPVELLKQHEATYRETQIPKPSGGTRRLEIPDDTTKRLQRRLLRYVLHTLNAHPMACGFEPETSIVHAALPHQNKPLVVKMDVRHFFECTSDDRIRAYFAGIGWNAESAELLTQLTTYNGHLPQGAPTSPRLSNLVNARMDEALLRLAKRHRGAYSRYADDITMSFSFIRGRKARGVTQAVRRILKHHGYTMHGGAKLNFFRQNQQQRVLGLVVNDKVALPRKTRRWLRAVKHHRDNGQPMTLTSEQLKGWEAFERMIAEQRDE